MNRAVIFALTASRLVKPRPVLFIRNPSISVANQSPYIATKRAFANNFANNGEDRVDSNSQKPSESAPLSSDDNYQGISTIPFPKEVTDVLLAPVASNDVEIKPDGLLFLPEIKYRRILNKAFGPGGWAMMPRGDTLHFQNDLEGAQLITREYALFCQGRFVAQATGEHIFYTKSNLAYGKACESAKSNALVRCCKDLGIASELWDTRFIKDWKKKYAEEVWCENVRTKDRKKLWRKKGVGDLFPYPWKE